MKTLSDAERERVLEALQIRVSDTEASVRLAAANALRSLKNNGGQ
jgi:hypothetical protein